MTKQPKQPQAADAVLGNQIEPPVTAAILGGLKGLQQRFLHLDTEQKLTVMPSLLELGEPGIDLLIAALEDEAIAVRFGAYQHLQAVDSDEAKEAIADGILVNPGDRFYSVYKSAISFDDEFFHLDSDFPDFLNEMNWEELGYADYEEFCMDESEEFGGGEISSYIPKRIAQYILQVEAEVAAEQLHCRLIREWDYNGDFEERSDFVLDEWCRINHVPFNGYLYELRDELKAQGNDKLLGKLWRDSVGDFAFVCEETVSEPQYLRFEGCISLDLEET